MLCRFSLLNTVFHQLPSPASVDQYKAVLGVHGLHHLAIQEGALELRQDQAFRPPGNRQNPSGGSGFNLDGDRNGQQAGVQGELILVWENRLSGGSQALLLTSDGVAVGFTRLRVVELVVEVGCRRQVLGVVMVAHVGVINQGLARLHEGAQAMWVAERGRGLGAALLLGLWLMGGGHGGALRGTLWRCWIQCRATCRVGFSYLHLVEVRLQTQTLRLLQVHPLLVQPVFLQLLL